MNEQELLDAGNEITTITNILKNANNLLWFITRTSSIVISSSQAEGVTSEGRIGFSDAIQLDRESQQEILQTLSKYKQRLLNQLDEKIDNSPSNNKYFREGE